MSHFAFVTTEYSPIVDGGAGHLVASLVAELRGASHDVSVVLVTSDTVDSSDASLHVVSPIDAAGWDIGFMAASKAAAEGVSALHRTRPIDRIEVQDFDGLAFWLLTHRGDLGLDDVPITVRFHGPVDLQIEAMGGTTHGLEVAAQMERESFAMADATIAPSDAVRLLIIERYGLEPGRVRIGTPLVQDLPQRALQPPDAPRFTVIGRLSEVKGSHDMVAASIPILREFPDSRVVFIGRDGWSVTANRSMREWLTGQTPRDLRDRFEFTDPLDAQELAEAIAGSTAVVAPSRFESFNLAVHESRRLGVPVVVPNLPAFSGFFDESAGAIVYDGSREGLTVAMRRLAVEPDLVQRLTTAPPPRLVDPLDVYRSELSDVRHRRSQGGLATAALARVESVRFPLEDPSRFSRLLRRVIGSLPGPLLEVARRVLPAKAKQKVRAVSDWDHAQERLRTASRWDAVARRVARGDFRDTGSPRVSVVIPCYNHGEYVKDAILSVFEQTMESFEVVIVDDGSDDGATPGILDALTWPRLRVIHQENVGLPGARNRGIGIARGEYVVMLDADDELVPTYLERMASALDADEGAAFAHCWAELFGDLQAVWVTRPYNRYQLLLSNSVVGCVMLRKAAWASVGGYDETMVDGNEDWDLWIRLMHAGFGAVEVREPLFRYRKHGVSMSVESESRYESALASLSRRLPHIYGTEAVRTLKESDYPLVTVITDAQDFRVPGGDVQVISASYDELHGVFPEVRGRYVVWWPAESTADTSVILGLCDVLEADRDAGAAETVSDAPIRVVRTWSVRDSAGPAAVRTVELPGSGERRLECSQFPDSDWSVPDRIGGIVVQRQRPEESGHIPHWMLS